MSKNDLYVKGMNMSESDEEEDVWDDTLLNAAFDKAMKVVNTEVAKRLAMATNSPQGGYEGKGKQKKSQHEKQVSKPTNTWKVGMPCRAVYEEDGLEYEALVVKIHSNNRCVVQFLGYDNRETVKTSSLKPTLGKTARTMQIEVAAAERGDDDGASDCTSTRREMDVDSERPPSVGSTVIVSERSSKRKKKSSKKKSHSAKVDHFQLPDIPMPNFNMMGNLGSMDMPMPPPLTMPSRDLDTEEQAVSSMLLSWYMSGYYTGLYQGIKRGKEQTRRRNS